jgi:hypothetical protein
MHSALAGQEALPAWQLIGLATTARCGMRLLILIWFNDSSLSCAAWLIGICGCRDARSGRIVLCFAAALLLAAHMWL